MCLLFSFEQLIINTEEAQEEEELRAQEEEQYKIREEIMKITGSKNESTSSYILKKLLTQQEMEQIDILRDQERIHYELNPADIIKEEDYEESVDG